MLAQTPNYFIHADDSRTRLAFFCYVSLATLSKESQPHVKEHQSPKSPSRTIENHKKTMSLPVAIRTATIQEIVAAEMTNTATDNAPT